MYTTKVNYILGIADNALILGQRLSELCGHGPSLETDIATTNIALDLLGQTRSYYQYAAELQGGEATEDTLAFLRKEREYKNVLLVEQPNTDFGYVMARQYMFDVFHLLLLEQLQNSNDEVLAAIAKKSIKEVSYHKRFSGDWIKRLGDGTEESHNRMQEAFDNLWTFTNELFLMTADDTAMVEAGVGVDVDGLKAAWTQEITALLTEATLTVPDLKYFLKGGKEGIHSEHMGFILTEMQYMQRTYPNMTW
ncbi:MAG: 1,2-phenylacetyl-CoA epoxidase subunit PaaC [Flavobacterium sp.]|jgi:ring-1,2-phenylacetyl-CoA epoxidase subunit PaaC|uniref:1,2-phenylacetyl-CoA epoxidase subunit PaaC n=2 Tax=Flavobacterium sp. TaxID=239 RepID=UPI0022CB88AF|nr:1,2-phenylacetyl-CoA epoxidase subunit PaaC [Flavobacterium sp.]MCZ8169018.1 phenylacetate-CoA oxygenase subunit PaaC [Flavobacterium sp.]MCZ8297194.1 phenylacetate-CoA oxygenase subunit PaaC [Flavobacterium sp.]